MSVKARDATAPLPRLERLPTHVAIIMDGNGRWAEARGLPRHEGHRAGTRNIRPVIERFHDHGVRCLTLFAFSTENWTRPQEEVNALLRLLSQAIRREARHLSESGIRLRHLGRLNGLPSRLQRQVQEAIDLTQGNDSMLVSVAFNYGGRAEILDAVRRLIADGIPPEQIDEKLFGSYLYSDGLPDPDLIIRTAGEMRLSNFLLWQGAYAEYYATSIYWPSFSPAEVDKALLAFSYRQRRFGGVTASPDPPGQILEPLI